MSLYAVVVRFRIGERVYLEGERVELTDSEAGAVGQFIEPVPADDSEPTPGEE